MTIELSLRRGERERANYRCASRTALRSYKFFQRAFETGIRNFHRFGVLHDGFAIGEKSSNGKGHGDAMITKTGDATSTQRRRPMDLEPVAELNHLRAHHSQIVRDGRNAISFLHS